MPNAPVPAAGEALPAKGQLILFHPALRQFKALDIPLDYVPGEEEFNLPEPRRDQVRDRPLQQGDAQLLRCTNALAVDEPKALDELRINWEQVLDYFDILMSIVAEARKRTETYADVAGINFREVA